MKTVEVPQVEFVKMDVQSPMDQVAQEAVQAPQVEFLGMGAHMLRTRWCRRPLRCLRWSSLM